VVDFALSEEHLALQRMVRDFAEKEVRPVMRELDRLPDPREAFPWDAVNKGAELGFHKMSIPEEYGGLGLDCLSACIIAEELGAVDAGIGSTYGACCLALGPIVNRASDEQRERFLRPICEESREAYLTAFAMTEPDCGPSAGIDPNPEYGLKTTAIADGDYYVVNGAKCFCTNGGLARLYTVIVRTDRTKGGAGSIGALVVTPDTPGFSIGKIEDKMGQRLSQQSEVIFDNARVPGENMLVPFGAGGKRRNTIEMLPLVGALGVGIARCAYEAARDYARIRKVSGTPIIQFQSIATMLADMAMHVETARMAVWRAAWYSDNHERPSARLSAMAKILGTDAAMKVSTDAVQVFGGTGYMRETGVEKCMRDAKLTQIYEVPNQIHRLHITAAEQWGLA